MQETPTQGLRWALVALCITVTTSYGVLYYAFPVLAPAISADTGWSLAAVTAAFSVGQILTAITGIAVGRLLDRFGPRLVMTLGAAVAAPALAAVALTHAFWGFVAAWMVAGTAMAALFYPPAFAALTHWYGPNRVRALTTLTLVAGLAGTIFAPLAAWMEGEVGWRGSYLVLALILAVVAIPLHAFGLRPAWHRAGGTANQGAQGVRPGISTVSSIVKSRAFLALTGSMMLAAFGVFAVIVNLVPLLNERGIDSQTAAWALGVGSAGQILGRLAYAPLSRRLGYLARIVVVLLTCALSTLLLAVVPGPLALIFVVSAFAGVARGTFTLIEATAVSDRWGTERYATLNGIMHTPLMLAIALAPWLGSVLAGLLGGYSELFTVLSVVGVLSALLALLSRPGAVRRAW